MAGREFEFRDLPRLRFMPLGQKKTVKMDAQPTKHRFKRRLCPCAFEPLEDRRVLDSTIVFNEILYHGADDQSSLEWIELYNQLGVDLDISSWRLANGIDFEFPEGTIISGGDYLVVASDPLELELQSGFSGALGPLLGQLSNGGEPIGLFNNNGRVMDQLDYDDGDPWPVGPDGSGFTLAKLGQLTASGPAENWMTSHFRGGTPGAENFPLVTGPELEATIELLIAAGDTAEVLIPDDENLGLSWTESTFDASTWRTGPTGVGYETTGGNFLAYGNLSGTSGSSPFPGALGHDFVVNSATTVTHLGVFDSDADGLGRTLTAELWQRDDNSGTRLAQLVFTPSDPGTLVGSNRIQPLTTPILMEVGDYTIVAHGYGAGELAGNEGFGGPSSEFMSLDDGGGRISFVGTSRLGTRAGKFPSTPDVGTVNYYSAGTFQFTTGSSGGKVATDIKSEMFAENTSAFIRIPFTASEVETIQSASLELTYSDGFVAYLNGQQIATRNAPAAPSWNSAATTDPPGLVTEVLNMDLSTTVINDNFDRADAILDGSTTPVGGAQWTANSSFNVVANGLTNNTANSAALVPFAAPSDRPYTIEVDVTRGSGTQNHSTFLILTNKDAGSLGLNGTGDSEVLAFSFHQDGDVGLWENNFNTPLVQFEGNNPLGNPSDPTHLLLEIDPVGDRVRAEVNGTEVINVIHSLNATPTMVGFGHSHLVPTSFDNFQVNIIESTDPTIAALQNGTNVLAIHGLNAVADDPQFVISGQLQVVKLPPDVEPPDSSQQSTLIINEIAPGGSSGFFVEIANPSALNQSLSGYVISSSAGQEYVFPAQSLASGVYLAVTEAELGFTPAEDDNLFLFAPDKVQVADARRVTGRLRGRSVEHDGRWLYPDISTPGATNSFDIEDAIVINEIFYHPFGQQPDTIDLDLSQNLVPTSLISTSTEAAVLVPANDSLGNDWQLASFDDSQWVTGPTGVGFETTGLSGIIAYTNLLGDGGSSTFAGTYGHDFTVNSTISVTQLGVFDSDADGLVRDLTAEIWSRDGNSGTQLTKLQFTSGEPGTLIDSSRFKSLATPLVLTPGQYTVVGHGYGPGEPAGHEGFAGPDSTFKTTDDGGGAISFVGTSRLGGTTGLFPATVSGGTSNYFSAGTFQFDTGGGLVKAQVATDIESQMHGVNSTAYVRVEFDAIAPAMGEIAQLVLQMKYDDGFIAYLNGTEVARRNAPAVPAFNSSATSEDEALSFVELDISTFISTLRTGTNALAIQGLNIASTDDDFLIVPELEIVTAPKPQNEWVELYNRGEVPVDLTGWEFGAGIGFDFSPGTTIAPDSYLVVARDAQRLADSYLNVDIVGDFSGRLSNRSELVALLDAHGNPADEVHYYQDGYWPQLADGGGSSLELQSPLADNSKAEAWAASEESSKSTWNNYSYRGIAGPTDSGVAFHELVIGLLDDGEMLLDEITVVEDPEGTARQLIQNSTFQSDTIGGEADKWRIYGNHFDSVVIDPENPNNQVLHLVATGRTDDMHNHGETTLKDGFTFVNIIAGKEYEISFRAKWLGGSNQFHTRLFYNRVAQTTFLSVPQLSGTPGAQNSQFAANVGPTFTGFKHSPVVPGADEAVTVRAVAEDPDGVSLATVHWSADGAAWQIAPMTIISDGQLIGTIPGHSMSTIVQFYIEATDAVGTSSMFPASGPDSRALFKVQDNQSQLGIRHNLRVIQTTSDKNVANQSLNIWSQHRWGATVVLDEDHVYYDASIRFAGRGSRNYSEPDRGYTIFFHTAHKFLGVHRRVSVDRQLLGEMLLKHLHNHAGGIPGMYNDAVHFIGPSSTSLAMLRMAGFGEVYLDEQFTGGSDSTLFEKEMIYRPHVTTTPGDPESFKLNIPFEHNFEGNTDIGDTFYGTDKEAYRPFWLIKNNRDRDDYSSILALNDAFRLSGDELDAATHEVIDVDQWLRVLATIRLAGVADWYSQPGGSAVGRGSWNHNVFFYQRPTDERLIMLPWDMDRSFHTPSGDDIVGNRQSAVADMILLSTNMRRFYGHFHDLINTTYNVQYGQYWANHYGQMFPGVDFQGPLNYINSRASGILAQLPAEIPFAINTSVPIDVGAVATATLGGTGWINVRQIQLAGSSRPLDVEWSEVGTDYAQTWEVTIPVQQGTHTYSLQAYDFQGNLIAADEIEVTSSKPNPVLESLRVTEINYNPTEPTAAELASMSSLNNDDFEFIEVQNVGVQAINLLGTSFTDGVTFTFPDVAIASGERGVVVRDANAFELRYGTGMKILGEFLSGQLANNGESLTLTDNQGQTVLSFTYGDSDPWPDRADGSGATLELIDPAGTPATEFGKHYRWRGSTDFGGSPAVAGVHPIPVVINEVLAHTDLSVVESDLIELLNSSSDSIDISSWWLSDSDANLLKFQIPGGTILDPGDYIVFDENDFNPTPLSPGPNDFELSGVQGDDVYLVISDGSGGIQAFVDDVHFGAASNGESFGRAPNGSGRLQPMRTRTLGSANAAPRVGPLVISEVNYHPLAPSAAMLAIEPSLIENDLEFIEILNPASQAVDLTNWRIRGDVDLDFVFGTMIGPGRTLVVVSFDPNNASNANRLAAFRAHYAIDEGVAIAGGYTGQMNNGAARVQLQRFSTISQDQPTLAVHLFEDELWYDNRFPWPTTVDGLGQSLHRTSIGSRGSDVGSWTAHLPNPGQPDRLGDTDLDGDVDTSDLTNAIINFTGAEGAGKTWSEGDTDGDGDIDTSDLTTAIINFTGAQAETAAVSVSTWVASGSPSVDDAEVEDVGRSTGQLVYCHSNTSQHLQRDRVEITVNGHWSSTDMSHGKSEKTERRVCKLRILDLAFGEKFRWLD